MTKQGNTDNYLVPTTYYRQLKISMTKVLKNSAHTVYIFSQVVHRTCNVYFHSVSNGLQDALRLIGRCIWSLIFFYSYIRIICGVTLILEKKNVETFKKIKRYVFVHNILNEIINHLPSL